MPPMGAWRWLKLAFDLVGSIMSLQLTLVRSRHLSSVALYRTVPYRILYLSAFFRCVSFRLFCWWGGFADYLQAPLQPLMDNLESQTYEAFEKDPVKYKQYERAIVKALELEKAKEGIDTTILMVRGRESGSGLVSVDLARMMHELHTMLVFSGVSAPFLVAFCCVARGTPVGT